MNTAASLGWCRLAAVPTGRGRGCRPPPGQVISRPRGRGGGCGLATLAGSSCSASLPPPALTHRLGAGAGDGLRVLVSRGGSLPHQPGEQQLYHCVITVTVTVTASLLPHLITADDTCPMPVSGAGSHCSQTGDHGRCVSALPTTQPNLA